MDITKAEAADTDTRELLRFVRSLARVKYTLEDDEWCALVLANYVVHAGELVRKIEAKEK